jgi:osmoprotectant transport system ATP-binding protein
VLEILNIHKSIGDANILSDVSLIVETGHTHALIGSSGSGKTTLIRVTLGLAPFDKGYVKINKQALLSFSPSEWSEKIGYVPQDGGLFPHLTARDNVGLVARLRGWDKSRIQERLKALCELVDLAPEIMGRFPDDLSGGQKQRVAIMRAAFLDPAVMLLDEPMGALDPLIRYSIQQELKTIFNRLKKTVLIVTHDFSEAVYLASQITLLHHGRVIQTGTYDDLALQPLDPFVGQFISAHRPLPNSEKAPRGFP